jgi:phage-related baseplate assembly protein
MTQRQIENLIKIGTVAEVDPNKNRIRMKHGGLTTDWLQYFVPAAGGVSVWRLPSVGEMGVVFSPSGETENGFVMVGIASASFPSPSSSPNETVIKFPDGAKIKYDHQSGALKAEGIKTADVEASVQVTIDTPMTAVKGQLHVHGLLTYSGGMSGSGGSGTTIEGSFNHIGEFNNEGKVVSNGVQLDDHDHPDLTSGGNTGKPNK